MTFLKIKEDNTMKKAFTFILAVSLTTIVFAQSPEKISYQTVVRNNSDVLVANKLIGMQISILQGSPSGTAVYVETQKLISNANGLVSLEIGSGTVVSGNFSSIDWANGTYFIKTETDPTGGTSYTITSTSQILSVPYALHSKTAEVLTGEITETDPVFSAWNKSTGISITESQISDLGTYIEAETDPVYTAWDKSTGILITESQISDLGNYIETETDPVFNAWDKSTGISITESQISDLGDYIEAETDPVFTSWDKSTGISITESQISDLGTYVETETDPTFTEWDKSTGISITESQISDLGDYIEAETDPVFAASVAGGITATDTTNWNNKLDSYTETDPIFATSIAEGITATDTANWNNKLDSYTETDPVFATSVAWSITSTDITNWNNKLDSYTETDPSVPTGMQAGDMKYWDGSEWVIVAATENEGAILQMINGVPTWTGGTRVVNVTNPTTEKIWMDRNLGASQAADSSNDADSYGDLYQWGRNSDGHQLRTSAITTTLSSTDLPGHANFILNSMPPYNWRDTQNDNLWQGVNGVNNPCPSGYRLPTEAEWEAERASWGSNNAAGAFASPLKLPVGGLRNNSSASFEEVGSCGYYWSSTVLDTYSRCLYFSSSDDAQVGNASRAYGLSVRCIKD